MSVDTDNDQGLKLWEEIHLTLKGMKHWTDYQIAKERKRLNKIGQTAQIPADIRIVGSAVVGANAFASGRALILPNIPSPDQGTVWLLRSLSIARGDADITTALAGTAWVFVGVPPRADQLGTISPIGLRTAQTPLPATGTWTGRAIAVKAEEYFYVMITGGTNTQEAYMDACFEAVQESAAPQGFEI